MTDARQHSDHDFLAAFLDASLPASGFDHFGHLRAAWLILQRHDTGSAIETYCEALARLAARLGAPEKYNRTLTEALLRIMASAGARDASVNFAGFLDGNPDLIADCREVLGRYYSPGLLGSAPARTTFLPPDRLPLPAA